MVYEITSTPRETADLFRSFHAAPDTATRRSLIEEAVLPSNSRVELKVKGSAVFDQDRINLSRSMAKQIDKVWGLVVSLRPEVTSANTDSPACAQVLIRIPFWDQTAYAYRSLFARINTFFADFAPRQPDSLDWAISRGDIVCGLVQRPGVTLL